MITRALNTTISPQQILYKFYFIMSSVDEKSERVSLSYYQ